MQIIGKRSDRYFCLVAHWPGPPMPTAIQAKQADSRWRIQKAEWLIGIATQPVLENEGNSGAAFQIVEPNVVV